MASPIEKLLLVAGIAGVAGGVWYYFLRNRGRAATGVEVVPSRYGATAALPTPPVSGCDPASKPANYDSMGSGQWVCSGSRWEWAATSAPVQLTAPPIVAPPAEITLTIGKASRLANTSNLINRSLVTGLSTGISPKTSSGGGSGSFLL